MDDGTTKNELVRIDGPDPGPPPILLGRHTPAVEAQVIASLQHWRDTRYQPPFNHPRPCKALEKLKEAAKGTDNLMEATLECARAGVTTGEWAGALREVFGELRAPPGGSSAPAVRSRVRTSGTSLACEPDRMDRPPACTSSARAASTICSGVRRMPW